MSRSDSERAVWASIYRVFTERWPTLDKRFETLQTDKHRAEWLKDAALFVARILDDADTREYVERAANRRFDILAESFGRSPDARAEAAGFARMVLHPRDIECIRRGIAPIDMRKRLMPEADAENLDIEESPELAEWMGMLRQHLLETDDPADRVLADEWALIVEAYKRHHPKGDAYDVRQEMYTPTLVDNDNRGEVLPMQGTDVANVHEALTAIQRTADNRGQERAVNATKADAAEAGPIDGETIGWNVAALLRRDGAMDRFRAMVQQWNRERDRQIAKHKRWEKERDRHFMETVAHDPALRDKNAKPPHDGWRFVGYVPAGNSPTPPFEAWCPPELLPEKGPPDLWPLSFRDHPTWEPNEDSDRSLTLPEKYTVCAAVHDAFCSGVEKVNPWRDATDGPAGLAAAVYGQVCDESKNLGEADLRAAEHFLADVTADLVGAIPAENRGNDESASPSTTAADGQGGAQIVKTVVEAVEQLKDEWATYEQLSKVTGKSQSAIRSAVSRAKEKKRITKEDEQDIPDSRPGMPKIRLRIRAVWPHI